MPKRALIILIVGFAVSAALIGLRLLTVVYTDWLWFSELGYANTFVTITLTKTLALFAFGGAFEAK